MTKVESLADLMQIKADMQTKMNLLKSIGNPESMVQVRVAMATCGIASGGKVVMDYLANELEKRNIPAAVSKTGCMGYCYAEPTIEVTRPGCNPVVFGYVDVKKADLIIEKFIKNGELIEGIIPVNYENIEG